MSFFRSGSHVAAAAGYAEIIHTPSFEGLSLTLPLPFQPKENETKGKGEGLRGRNGIGPKKRLYAVFLAILPFCLIQRTVCICNKL